MKASAAPIGRRQRALSTTRTASTAAPTRDVPSKSVIRLPPPSVRRKQLATGLIIPLNFRRRSSTTTAAAAATGTSLLASRAAPLLTLYNLAPPSFPVFAPRRTLILARGWWFRFRCLLMLSSSPTRVFDGLNSKSSAQCLGLRE